jgi:CheY-like chemotaxis protein
MFNAFQQADSSISRRYGGTGLGLPIARTLAERMGGTLRAQSEEGLGSVFTLEIPLAIDKQPLPPWRPARPMATGMAKGAMCCWWRTTRSTRPSSKPCCAAWALPSASPPMARRRSQRREPDFEAILMDCRLPIIDGYEATRQIRQLPGLRRPADHRPDRQRLAGRPRSLPVGGHERLPGQAVQTQ